MTHKVERDLIKTDLFQAVNGAWLETAVIPDDKPTTGGFSDLADKVEADLMKDLADLIDQPQSLTKMQKEMVAYYQLALDKEGRATLGMSPLRPYIDRIQALTSVADLTEWAKTGILEGLPGPFSLGVIQDMADSNRYVVHLGRPGLILPDRTYYEPDHAQGQQLLAVYRQVALDLLALLGLDVKEAVELVTAGMAFDARLAPYTLSKEEAAEYVVFHNPRKLDQVAAYSDQIDFKAVLESVLGGLPETLNVGEPKFFEAFKQLVDQADLNELKAWLTLRLVTGATSYLSEEAREELTTMSRLALEILDQLKETVGDNLEEVNNQEQLIDQAYETFERMQIQRLKSKVCGTSNSVHFAKILTDFERIGDHCLNIAQEMNTIHPSWKFVEQQD